MGRIARHRDHGHVPLVQVNDDVVEIVGPPDSQLGVNNEAIDDKLASPGEKLRQALIPVRSFEPVVFRNRLPRKRAT